jgi:hypothetical protein
MAGPIEFILGIERRLTRIDSLVVDCTEFINTTLRSTITRWPVERNPQNLSSSISDNIQLEPVSFTMNGFISNTPLGGVAGVAQSVAQGVLSGAAGRIAQNSRLGGTSLIGTGLGAAVGATVGGALGTYLRGPTEQTYAQKAMLALLNAYRARKPFTVRTYFFPQGSDQNIYTNLVITNLDFPQDVTTGDDLPFTMSCEQIDVVDLQLTDVSGDFMKGFNTANSAPKKIDLGQQGTKPPTAQVETRTSFLVDIKNTLGGFL